MKKYIAAAAVAVMVFAFAAFAASLTVNAGPLQAGSDNDLKCTESIDVGFSGHEGDAAGVPGQSAWTTVVLSGYDADCEGTSVYVRVFNADDLEIWRSSATDTLAEGSTSIDVGTGSYRGGYELRHDDHAQRMLLGTVDIERVDVLIQP